ncbi:MAG: hypothetical protein RL490_694 [Pseudomonadota bacterium]|jgi:sterol desaturase/sphingolipid hydroxylase (fatty acid hydroxylase superfamily)
MQAFLTSHLGSAQWLLPVFRSAVSLALMIALFAPLEYFFAQRASKRFAPGWLTNLGWYFLNGLTAVFILGPPTALLAASVHAIIPAAVTGAAAALPLWAKMIAAMIVGEIGFYWGHRLSHEIPFLWRFHAVHHSAETLNFLVNTRAHPIDMVFTRLCGLALLYATGLANPVGPNAGLIPALVLFVGSLWSFFIHANVRFRLGFFEEILSSPAFHHWHHSRNDHIDRNYASMLPVMDRVFGTFYLPRHWPAEYGTDTVVPTSLVGQIIAPFVPERKVPPRA